MKALLPAVAHTLIALIMLAFGVHAYSSHGHWWAVWFAALAIGNVATSRYRLRQWRAS